MNRQVFRRVISLLLIIMLLFTTYGLTEGIIASEDDSEVKSYKELEEFELPLSEEESEGKCLPEIPEEEIFFDNMTEENASEGIPSALKLGLKETYVLDASKLSTKTVAFTSSKPKIASVSAKGKITAKKKGETKISCKQGEETLAVCKVTVLDAPKKVTLNKKKLSLEVGKTYQLKGTLPKKSASQITWKSNNTKVVKVNKNGLITALGAGKAKITAKTFNGKKATCSVTVKAKETEEMSWEDFAEATATLVEEYAEMEAASDSEYASGRLIAKVKGVFPDISKYKVVTILRDPESHYLIQLNSPEEAEKCAKYLEKCEEVEYVEPDSNILGNIVSIYGTEVESYSWGVPAIHADAYAQDLKNRNKTREIVVAVVDSGVYTSHEMLKGKTVSGRDLIENDNRPQDGNGHGTHVSGIIVDCTQGLNVKIMPVRVLGDNGRGSISIVAQGVRYAANHGANVINLSLGGGHASYLDEAINYAVKKGVIVVAAAGNESTNIGSSICPAHNTNCITVAAVNSSKERAYFSNFGNAVDIAAPGVNVRSAYLNDKYADLSGTSMAAPHVSAAAAMLLCDNSGLTPSSVERMLREAATDLGESGWDA